MNYKEFRKYMLASAMSASILAAYGGVSFAQEAEADTELEEIVVTGSLIPQSGNLIETSPVTSIDAEDLLVRGSLRVEDMLNTLPQAFGAQGANLANGASGTASVNLRGLGASRTLVLVNGRRLPYGSINIYASDLNIIPSQLVKNVDILTGGASAAYGSDAISGVVNFNLDTDFEGVKFDANYSFYQHNNDGDLQDLLATYAEGNPSQFRVPSGNVTDGDSVDFTGVLGSSFDDDRGHFTAFFTYTNTEPILQDARDYSQCALGTQNGGTEFSCSGSSTNQFANILDLSPGYDLPNDSIWARVNPTNGTFESRDFVSDTFNYNPYNHYQRPSERYAFGTFINYQVAENVELYSEVMFMDNRTNSQIAPSGVFGLGVSGSDGGINCNNVFFSDQQREFLCGSNGLSDDDVAPVLILRRNVEGGLRNQDIRHTTFRGVLGFRGDIENTPFSYDAYALYAQTHRADVYNNDLSKKKIANALNAVADADGNPACAINVDADPANDDPNCVAYDIWSGNSPDPAAVAYIANPLNRDGVVTQQIVSAKVYGDLTEWGWVSPYAEQGVNAAFGIEYREDTLDSNPDANFQSGDGAGQGGPTNPIDGAQDVVDIFAEVNIPIIQGQLHAETLGVDLAYRRSEYENTETDSYKVGVEYAPVTDIRFRASYQRAVRAANLFERFTQQGIGLFDLTEGANGLYDPCAGETPRATFEQCARTGVTEDQYGSIGDNPAGQFNNLTGGNPDLDPETSDTFTIGFVATPSAIPGLVVSLDYFDIEVQDYINTVPETAALDNCLQTGDDYFCGLVNRGAGGTLWANETGYITATNINTGSIATSGFDLLTSYVFETSFGEFEIDYVGTFLQSLEVEALPGDTPFDCAGMYGNRCSNNFGTGSNPEYRHKFDVNWITNYDIELTGTWRYISETSLDNNENSSSINATLADFSYFDLSGRYNLSDKINLRLGVNNLLDEDPPLSSVVGTAPGNGNTYPQVYDALGRYVFMGVSMEF